ncbi:MAG: peptide chain release factor 2 [Myxococcales bacterium FL481]|nr:MAG: peptide chain release factor 2 [Myxococcales bacterium FL481]
MLLPEHNKVIDRVDRLGDRLGELRGIFDYAVKVEKIEELEAQASDAGFWDDGERAQRVLRDQAQCKRVVEAIDAAQGKLDEAKDLYELAREEGDDESVYEAWALLDQAEVATGRLEFQRMLSGEHDIDSALVSVSAGAGGVDSQEWAQMLVRMYQRWGERHGYAVRILDFQEADQAGIRGAELEIVGEYAYGHLRSEIGVHRLVRISPFDAQARRQTSFAGVMVVPDIDEDDASAIDVPESDLRIDKYRSSGAGGQHVNKTESAVRLTHLPSGIVVACQSERSQHKNMATALRMLKARLWDIERQKRDDKMQALEGSKKLIEWGSQIRSYVMHPYRQVNDHRTEFKTADVDSVLDGELDALIEAYLLRQGASHHDNG